jgi:hypothetical protein
MHSSLRRFLVLSATVAAAFALTACEGEVNIGEDTVSASELEKQSAASLTEEFGQEPASVSCPEDLKAEVGESEVCSLEDQQGGTYDMTVTITSVDDEGNAQFDIQVGDLKTVDPS